MSSLAAVVAGLACYRVVMLVTADEVSAPWRQHLQGWLHASGRPRLAAALECPWCVSVWVAPPVVGSALWWSAGWGWWLVAGSLACSGVTGLLASVARP